jgi:hypothetical protein
MKRHLFLLAALGAFSPDASMAQTTAQGGNDLAYCTQLYDLAVKYRGRQINGESKPDPDMIVALEQCKHGNANAGIATLAQRLRSADVTVPPR